MSIVRNNKPRIVFIHGNDTLHWSFAWPKILKKELEKSGFPTFFETFPDSILARSKYWLSYLSDYVKAGEKDVIVGWSSGAVAALRYAESNKILGSVLVSCNYTDLGDSMEKQSGYYATPWNWEKIKSNQQKIALFYGDNDPFIPQSEFEFIANRISADTHIIPGGKHFIEYEQFPELLDYIRKSYG